jgi:tRNA nucleotidyltransferase (CCA-adding enzyme)
MDFVLTYEEKQIFELLRTVVARRAPQTIVRAAGGWIRDKLLGLESKDIDICVDNMSGKAFAELTHQWMKDCHMKVKPIATVDANVEANKHLESAILPIYGVEVDFVQLRKETYDTDSRNPQIEVGVTAEDDARRRDLTINSMFYNLNAGEIEDFCGGRKDLENRVARTPIDPLRTYLEDPLRILRAIRFAARFGLSVDSQMFAAARDARVQEALAKKVSRERIWTEMSKFMVGPRMAYAVELIHSFGLRDLLLAPTDDQLTRARQASDGWKWIFGFDGWDKDQNNPHHTFNVWVHTISALKWLEDHPVAGKDDTNKLIRNVALLLHDVGKCDICSRQVHPEGGWSTYHEHEISSAYAANEILRDLKAPNEIRERAVKLVRNHMRLHVMPKKAKTGLRRTLRDVGVEDWDNLVEMSKADSMGKLNNELDPKYDHFDAYIKEFVESLDGASEVKPPLNGHQIMQILEIKPGPIVGQVMNELKERLLQKPDLTEDEAVELVKDKGLFYILLAKEDPSFGIRSDSVTSVPVGNQPRRDKLKGHPANAGKP